MQVSAELRPNTKIKGTELPLTIRLGLALEENGRKLIVQSPSLITRGLFNREARALRPSLFLKAAACARLVKPERAGQNPAGSPPAGRETARRGASRRCPCRSCRLPSRGQTSARISTCRRSRPRPRSPPLRRGACAPSPCAARPARARRCPLSRSEVLVTSRGFRQEISVKLGSCHRLPSPAPVTARWRRRSRMGRSWRRRSWSFDRRGPCPPPPPSY